MKKILLIISLTLFLLLGLIAVADCFTYESELNPEVINVWEIVGYQFYSNGTYMAVAQNPDSLHSIAFVFYVVNSNSRLAGYSYLKGNELYVYRLDYESDCYVRVNPPDQVQESIRELLASFLNKVRLTL